MAMVSLERIEYHTLPSTEGVPFGFWENRIKELPHPELSKVYVLPNRQEAARLAAEKILEVVENKPEAAISWPSGNQGNDVIDEVVRLSKERGVDFSQVQFFHLDEYFPIRADQPESFRRNLRERLFAPLNVPEEHIHEICADPGTDGNAVAADYEAQLAKQDIDLVLHPIGPDGHIAFDEAGTPRDSLTHLASLSDKTIHRDRVIRKLNSPDAAITQGIGTIKRAKKILFIDFSPDYAEDMKEALYGPIGEHNPSSLLREVGAKVEVITTQEIAAHFPKA